MQGVNGSNPLFSTIRKTSEMPAEEIFDIMHKRKVKSTVAILRDKIHKNS